MIYYCYMNDNDKGLENAVENLEDRIERTNDPKRVFFFGILSGFGGAIGATILFGLVITAISTLLYKTGLFPSFNEFLNSLMQN